MTPHNPTRPHAQGAHADPHPPPREQAPLRDLTDILADAANGDSDAWTQLVNRYHRRVFAFALSRLRSHDAAEELTQSVFVTLAKNLPTQDGYQEQGKFEAWLFRIAMNRIRDEGRRRTRHARLRPTLENEQAAVQRSREDAGAPTDTDALTQLRKAISELSDADRAVVELRHHGELSFREIAETLEEPIGTVLARHHRALKKLRNTLDPDSFND